MQYKIMKNVERKTITLVLSKVTMGFTDYLFDKFQPEDETKDAYYMANGVLSDAKYKEDIVPLAQAIANALNEVNPSVKIVPQDILSLQEKSFAFIRKNMQKDGSWNGDFSIFLKNKSKSDDKKFLFKNFKNPIAIDKEDGWKHEYAIEVEISSGNDENTLENYTFSVFHRAISVGSRESSYRANDDAWSGFDFGSDEEEISDDEILAPAKF